MAAKTGSNDNDVIAEINVVPLVDIILVVLIIFMVAAPMVMQPKIDITLPKSASTDMDKSKKPLKILLSKDGDVLVNNKPITLEGLKTQAAEEVKVNPEVNAILVADKSVTLDMITQIVDAVKSQGLKKIAFSIQK